jgi:hypothetical protein
MIFGLLCIGLFSGVLLLEKKNFSKQQFVVFHKNRQTLLGYKNGATLLLFQSDTLSNLDKKYPIKSYKVGQHIGVISENTLPTFFMYKDKKILILDSLGAYPRSVIVDVVLLTQSSKINLDRLLDSLQPKIILADGSNYSSYVARWRKTCEKRKLPFHHTGSEGAFIVE